MSCAIVFLSGLTAHANIFHNSSEGRLLLLTHYNLGSYTRHEEEKNNPDLLTSVWLGSYSLFVKVTTFLEPRWLFGCPIRKERKHPPSCHVKLYFSRRQIFSDFFFLRKNSLLCRSCTDARKLHAVRSSLQLKNRSCGHQDSRCRVTVDEALGYRDVFNHFPPSGAGKRLYGSQIHTLFCPGLKCGEKEWPNPCTCAIL